LKPFELDQYDEFSSFDFVSIVLIPDADRDLVFKVNNDGRYEAAKIPPQVGMKAGDVVEGVVKEGDDAGEVTPVVSSRRSIGKTFSLGELAKLHRIDLEGDILVLEKKTRYCTHLVKLDTKDYGLPQTRNRKVSPMGDSPYGKRLSLCLTILVHYIVSACLAL
jgi:hypothetical protein